LGKTGAERWAQSKSTWATSARAAGAESESEVGCVSCTQRPGNGSEAGCDRHQAKEKRGGARREQPAREEANLSTNQRMRPRPRMLRNSFTTNETDETGLRSKTKSKSKERNNRSTREQQKSGFSLRNNKSTTYPQWSPPSLPHLIGN
jgi:hypothetical protein